MDSGFGGKTKKLSYSAHGPAVLCAVFGSIEAGFMHFITEFHNRWLAENDNEHNSVINCPRFIKKSMKKFTMLFLSVFELSGRPFFLQQ
jgi:hypothetical protein